MRQEKNASAFFDLLNLLRRTLTSSSHPRGSDEPLGPRRWASPKWDSDVLPIRKITLFQLTQPVSSSCARYFPLAPAPDMLKIEDWDEYRRRYREEVLSVLDPDKVLRDLGMDGSGHDIVLLCFEKERAHCHRGLVAEWFSETKGITVPELGEEPGRQQTPG